MISAPGLTSLLRHRRQVQVNKKKQEIEIVVYDGGDEDDPSTIIDREIIYDGGGEDGESNKSYNSIPSRACRYLGKEQSNLSLWRTGI